MTVIQGGAGKVRGELLALLARHRIAAQVIIDALSWLVALGAALLVRYDFAVPDVAAESFFLFLPVVFGAQISLGLLCGLYRGRWRVGSFDEVAALARAAVFTSTLLLVATLVIDDRPLPVSVPVGGGAMALVASAGARYTWRLLLERHRRPSGTETKRMVVFGAGDGGAQALGAMLRDPESRYVPVALIDDDPRKRNLRMMKVPVMGTRGDLATVAGRVGADALLVAIPSADAELIREVTDLAEEIGLDVKVLPPVDELWGGQVQVGDIRSPTMADMLGRHEIDTDVESIAGYLSNKRVLVTGAGGSIGSELCRQIQRFAPAELIMLDRDESALHCVQLSLTGQAMLDSPNLVVADIRDRDRVHAVFARWRPEVVFHAAALKHLPLLEQHPCEAVKTNVWGSQHVLDAAVTVDVGHFVNISTDKAANPTSVLGYTKRIAERLTADAARGATGTYLSVRFGNVLGSRGSVLGAFRSQIERGGPVTVTDREVTRFFMTVQEAVQLVIQAGAIGRDGEVLVLDMGEAVRIDDLAKQLVAKAERSVEIIYTGIRRGEKLHEVLWGAHEVDFRPTHPLISHVGVPPLAPESAAELDTSMAEPLIADLRRLCENNPVPPRWAFQPR